MDIRKDLGKRIEKERQKIIGLRGELDRSEAFILGLQEALKMLPKERERKPRKRKMSLRPSSDMAKIRDLIKQTGRPMYIGEIVIGLGRPDTKANRMSIAGSLGRYVRPGEVFKRVRPNTFTLIGMDSLPEVELPPDFGAEEIGNSHSANSSKI